MNFTNRDSSTQQSQAVRNNQGGTPGIVGSLNGTLKSGRGKKGSDWIKGTWAIMLVSLMVIVLSLVYLLHIANPNEGKYVAGGKLQAVFLQNGQVYFGKIKTVSQKYIDLQGIFYLNNSSTSNSSSSSTSSSNLSLVKLGCELHGPYDEMIINADQVTFWENLRPDGQVAKAVAQYQQQNPKGQTCSQSSSSTSQATGTTQGTSTPQSSTPAKP